MKSCLIIVGSAECMLEDFEKAKSILSNLNYKIMAIGLDASIKFTKHVDYIASYHPNDFEQILEKRKSMSCNIDYKTISHINHEKKRTKNYGINIVIPFEENEKSGSSALLGVYAGQLLGFEKIILCGCPLEGKNTKGYDYRLFRKGWETSKKLKKEIVRSMSGWTKEFLGEPTMEWINE